MTYLDKGGQFVQNSFSVVIIPSDNTIVPFHKDFSPSGEQPEHRKLDHEL